MEGTVRRGDIFYADLSPVIGSEQGGTRPVLIIQNDTGNKHSPTVIVAAITSKMNKAKLPTHIEIDSNKYDIVKDSVILLEQVRTLDKRRLKEKMGHLDDDMMSMVNSALAGIKSTYNVSATSVNLRHTRDGGKFRIDEAGKYRVTLSKDNDALGLGVIEVRFKKM